MVGRFLSRIGMFGFLIAVSLGATLSITACSTPPPTTGEQTVSATHPARPALLAVTSAREAATAALRAGTINVARHRALQAKLDDVRAAALAPSSTAAQIDKAKRDAEAIRADPKGVTL